MATDINQLCWDNAIQHFLLRSTQDPGKRRLAKSLPACTPEDLVMEVQRHLQLTATTATGGLWTRLQRFAGVLSPYCSTIDTLVQHDPHNTALVWGSIRVIIQILVAQQQTSDEINGAFDFIGYQIDHYHKSLSLFPEELREATTQIYACVFELILRVRAYLELPRASRFLKAALGTFRQKLEKVQLSIRRWDQIRDQIFWVVSEKVHRCQADHVRQSQVAMERARKIESEVDKTHRWLDIPLATAQNNSDRREGTCTWIFQDETFQQWTQHPGEGCLWIHGKPGCGKSTMAKYLASTMKDRFIFTHFFRSHGDFRFGLASNFALSLISKALDIRDVVEAPGAAQVLTNINALMAIPSSKCTLQQLLTILEQVLDLLPAATILVDALDECRDIEPPGDDALSGFLRRFGTRKDHRVILFSTSHYFSLARPSGSDRAIAMDEKAIAGDIRLFLESEIDRAGLGDLRVKIIQKGLEESRGMFLWVVLMMNHVKDAPNLKKCRESLDELPPGLFQIFETFLRKTAGILTREDHELRYNVLLLLVGAHENLTAAEISTAMAFSPDTHELDNELKLINAETRIAKVCRPFVELTPDGRIQFIHSTVKDFFLRGQGRSAWWQSNESALHLSLQDCHQSLARRTLASLTQGLYQTWQHCARLLQHHLLPGEDLGPALAEPAIGQHNDFYNYSCRHWQDHLTMLADPDQIILDLLRKFLPRNGFVAWSEAMVDLANLSAPSAQVSVRAALQQWHSATLKPGLRPKVPLDGYFLETHQALRDELAVKAQSAVLPYLPLARLGEFYNVGGETVEEWELGYRFKSEVVCGYEATLGKRNRFTLNARTSLYQEYLWKMRMEEAREGLDEVAKLQLESVGTELPDYYTTLFYLGAVEFHLTMFEDARQTLVTSADGLKRLLGNVNSKAIQAELFMGYALEAEGCLSQAAALYEEIWNKWTDIAGGTNGIGLMIETAQGSCCRKQGHLETSRDLLYHSWTERKRLFTVDNNVTVDSGIQLAILLRDLEDNARATDILAEVVNSGIFPADFERSCQVDHLRALIDFDSGRYSDGKNRLLRCLEQAWNSHQNHHNRELLWIRITLADALRCHGEGDHALMLFADLVSPLSFPDELVDEPEPRHQLEIAEEALRYLKSYNQTAAAELLQHHRLKWKRTRDFWVLQGGPISDTAWMAPPRDVPG